MNISIDTNEACHGRSVSIKEEMAAVDELQEGSVGHNTAEHELSPSEYTGIETSSATPQSSPATRMSDATNMGVGDRSVFGDELGCVVKLEAESDSVSHFARTESQVKAESMLTIHCSGYDSSAELSAGQVKLQTITPNSGEVKQEIMMDESPSEMLLDQNFRNNTHSVKLGCESVDHNRDDDDERTEPASVSGNKSICSRSSSEVPTLGQENGCLLAKFITKQGQSRFNKHVLKHSDERPFTCGECGEAFTSASHLQGHERRHSSIKPFMCAICGETFKHGRLLTEHRRSHAEEGAFACSDCGRKCSNPRELTKHIQSVHPDNPSNRPHVCSLCPAAFQRRYHLKTHMRSHTGEKPYKCDMCGQSYSTQGTLKVHIRSHTGERPYKCVECGRGFITSGQLKKHSRTHNKPVITVSEDNSTVYVQTLKPVPHLSEDREEDGGDMEGEETATLKLEIESYPKDCTYSCSLCEERVFLRPIDLASHMRHDHPQPVKKESVCPDCGLIFSRPHTLKIHMKAHLGGKLFKCNTCGKEFAQKNNLTAHIQTHSLC